jgi:hypothetical protein
MLARVTSVHCEEAAARYKRSISPVAQISSAQEAVKKSTSPPRRCMRVKTESPAGRVKPAAGAFLHLHIAPGSRAQRQAGSCQRAEGSSWQVERQPSISPPASSRAVRRSLVRGNQRIDGPLLLKSSRESLLPGLATRTRGRNDCALPVRCIRRRAVHGHSFLCQTFSGIDCFAPAFTMRSRCELQGESTSAAALDNWRQVNDAWTLTCLHVISSCRFLSRGRAAWRMGRESKAGDVESKPITRTSGTSGACLGSAEPTSVPRSSRSLRIPSKHALSTMSTMSTTHS